jgi:ribulose-phosphate 3-epimerase
MTNNPFTSTAPMICASVLSADMAKLGAEIGEVLTHGADFLHLDVIGPAYLDAHLMVTDPLKYAGPMVKAGAQNITFHCEVVENPGYVANALRAYGCHVGVTLDPETPVERIWPALDHVDLVLVMSVKPGFSGQKFKPEVLGKCEAIKKRLRPAQRLQIDGGINTETVKSARDAGVDWFVVASAIFDQKDRAAAIREIRAKIG